MSAVVVDISSLVRWNRLLAVEAASIAGRVERAVSAEAGKVLSSAEAAAPVDTGALRSTIRTTGRGLRQRVKAGGGRAHYAVFQEFGTGKMAASPFLITQANQQTMADFERKVQVAVFAGQIMRGGA